jgi:hypothetical protein
LGDGNVIENCEESLGNLCVFDTVDGVRAACDANGACKSYIKSPDKFYASVAGNDSNRSGMWITYDDIVNNSVFVHEGVYEDDELADIKITGWSIEARIEDMPAYIPLVFIPDGNISRFGYPKKCGSSI